MKIHAIFPSLREAATSGEAAVRRQLEVLPDDYTVFLNYEAMSQVGRVLSEFDDVVVTPTGGILVLEVKTGQLSVDETGNLIRERKEGILDISAQIATQHRLILTRLKSRFPGKHLRFKHFLVIPYGQIAETSSFNDLTTSVIDSKRVPFLAEIVQNFNAEYIDPEDVLVLAGGLPMLDMVRASSQSTAAADAPAELRLAAQKVTLTDAAAGSAVEVLYRMVRDAENLA